MEVVSVSVEVGTVLDEADLENESPDNISEGLLVLDRTNQTNKKRKHEDDISEKEVIQTNKSPAQLSGDEESDDGAFCPIVSKNLIS